MKIPFAPTQSSRRTRVAFTIPELMVAMALFGVMLTGVLSSHLFGMRMFRISETKLSASSSARKALNQVRDEIRGGKMVYVGNGGATTFTNTPDNFQIIGNAIQVYATTNTNSFVRFYLDPNDNSLKRVSSSSVRETTIASYITNRVAFSAEDFKGNVLTNSQNNRVIRMMLEFYQWEFPITTAGAGAMYDYYRLNTRITRRTIE